jgi:hypothetical protein
MFYVKRLRNGCFMVLWRDDGSETGLAGWNLIATVALLLPE